VKRRIRVIVFSVLVLCGSLLFISFSDKDFQIAKNLDIFVTLFRELNLYYVDDTDPEELIESGIEGMLGSLDPYTTFIPESDMDDFKFMTTGQYGGIGALIRKAGEYTMISEPYEGFPAHKSGLRAGDTIISINGISTRKMDISDVSELLKGTPNTSLELSIRRIGSEKAKDIEIVRERISINNVPFYGMLDEETGYIRLSNFTKDAAREVKKAVMDLKDQNARALILDLRSNPGGLLMESVGVSNLFVKKGQEIVSTRGKIKKDDNVYITTSQPVDTNIPLVVLVDRRSASASEIVAGAMQDLDRAVIIGRRTFGKGLVQRTRPLSYNTQLKVTTAKYYIPSGRCIQALDYTHRNEDGSVGYIPDSLISEFKTLNGRTVYDGGGIRPDITVEEDKPGNLTINLYANNMFFDYATVYSARHDSIPSPEKYTVTDALYDDFKEYISDQEFDYTTRSDDKLEELIKMARQESYYSLAEEEFEALKKKLTHDLSKDFVTFRDEITSLLAEEIVSRYYYQKGRIRVSLKDDKQMDKAMEVLYSDDLYRNILSGNYVDESVKTASRYGR